MRLVLALILSLQTTVSFGVDFSSLSRNEPVSTVYPATFKCYVDVSLFVSASDVYDNPIFLKLSYIIGTDTLYDNLKVENGFNDVVKQLFVDEGERLTVSVQLNNAEIEQLDNIEGALKVIRNPNFDPAPMAAQNTFLSSVWKSDQTPLFRISKQDSVAQFFRLKLDFNKNYDFDKFHFKLKVISPKDGIVLIDRSLAVNENGTVAQRQRSFYIDIKEIDMRQEGTYYFQVMSNMLANRVNGIDKISYELVDQ